MVVGPPPIDVTKRNKIRDPLPTLRRYVIFEWALCHDGVIPGYTSWGGLLSSNIKKCDNFILLTQLTILMISNTFSIF